MPKSSDKEQNNDVDGPGCLSSLMSFRIARKPILGVIQQSVFEG